MANTNTNRAAEAPETPKTRTRYIVLHSMVGSTLAGNEYVPAKGEDISHLLALNAIAEEVIPVDAEMPQIVESGPAPVVELKA